MARLKPCPSYRDFFRSLYHAILAAFPTAMDCYSIGNGESSTNVGEPGRLGGR
jgi:hypothetical protein